MAKPIRVLVVEDSENDTALVIRQLQQAGYATTHERVETAEDMAAALTDSVWDIVLSDYSMPALDAPRALKVLQDTAPDTPFIVVSGSIGEDIAVQMMKSGANDYVMKDKPARLVSAIERELREAELRREKRADDKALIELNEELSRANEEIRATNEELAATNKEIVAANEELRTTSEELESAYGELEEGNTKLKVSETRYRRLFESAKDGILILDAESGMVVDVNPFLTQLLGISYEQFQGQYIWDLRVFRDIAASHEHFLELQRNEYVRYEDLPLEAADGRRINVEFVSNVYLVNSHKVIQCNVRDISDRVRAEKALRESQERYTALTNAAMDGFWVVDETGRLLEVNDAYCAMSGYSREQLLSMCISDLEQIESPEQTREHIEQIKRAGWAHFETQHRRADGSLLDLSVSVTALHSRSYMIVFMTDITERRRAEQALRDSERRLLEAQQIAHLGDWSVDFETNTVHWSHENYMILGLDPQLVTASVEAYLERVIPQDQALVHSGIQEAISSGFSEADIRIAKPDGTPRVINGKIHSFIDENGKVTGIYGTMQDVTDRKLTEAALKYSEQELLEAQHTAQMGSWTWNFERNDLIWSAEHYRIFGLDPRDGPQPYAAFIDNVIPEDRESLNESIQEALTKGTPYDVDFGVTIADGTLRVMNAKAKVAFDASGKPISMTGTIQDITERKLAEKALVRSETRFRTLYDASSEAVMLLDENGFFDCNAAALQIFRCQSKEELCSKHPADLSPACQPCGTDSTALASQRFTEAMQNGSLRFEWLHKRVGTGAVFPAEVLLSRMSIDGHTVLQATVRDITERKQAEEQRALLHAAIEQARDTVLITDPRGVISYVNPAFERVTGYTAQEAVGGKPSICASGQHSREFYTGLWETIRSGQVWSGRFTNRRKDGQLYFEDAVITPLANKAGEITSYLGVQRDVTGQMQKELELRQAQMLEAVGRLAAGIAHEINTPMQYVSDNTVFLKDALDPLLKYAEMFELLLSQEEAGEVDRVTLDRAIHMVHDVEIGYLVTEIPRAIEQSMEGIGRVTKIVQAMREFSHPGLDLKSKVDLNRAIESTITIARHEWKYIADLQTDLEPNLPAVPCFPGDINQVILNLIINAAHAIAELQDGQSSEKGTIRISTRSNDGYVEMRVADTGCGIREEIRDHVFEPFFTTKGIGKGTGQGLAIAYAAVVERHGGRIFFETETGKGTTFVIQLPVAILSQEVGNAQAESCIY